MTSNITNISKKHIYEMIEYYGPDNKQQILGEEDIFSVIGDNKKRKLYIKHFGFSVPSQESIIKLTKYIGKKTVLEVGAGLGLWAYLLSLEGVNIKATDIRPHHHISEKSNILKFIDVKLMDFKDAIKKYKSDILMIIWAPHGRHPGAELSHDSIKMFTGNTVIYIGEDLEMGCTGTPKCSELIKKEWKLINNIYTPQWGGLYTKIFIFERK